MSAFRTAPRNMQLRLDEVTDAELLALLRAARDAKTDDAWYDAVDGLKNIYRSTPDVTHRGLHVRVAALRAQVREEVQR